MPRAAGRVCGVPGCGRVAVGGGRCEAHRPARVVRARGAADRARGSAHAAVLEGKRFIGCELSAEYAEIARARIAHHGAQGVLV